LGCGREHTLEEIGHGLDVTRERVRQIELRALRKLRRPESARRLRSLLT
jgi:RNA polymerase primary sigma factor